MTTLDVMGITEIAARIGRTPDAVAVLNNRGKLPPPDATIGGGRTKVWRRSTIEKWASDARTKHYAGGTK